MTNRKLEEISIVLFLILMLSIPVMATTITGQGSSYNFNISNCVAIPSTPLSCSPANIRFECQISNPSFINLVQYKINGVEYTTSQNLSDSTQFYYLFHKNQDTSDTSDPINLEREGITDTNNIRVNAYETVSIARTCVAPCQATFTTIPVQTCNSSNQQITQYISSNASCTPNYNATETCNFCNPDIRSTTTTCSFNRTRTITYTDLNYDTCCLQTGTYEDCIINSVIYNNASETCDYLTQEFNCSIDKTPVMNSKINVNCELPSSTEEFNCIVNTYQEFMNSTETTKSTLLATSPEYKKTTDFFLFWAVENEERSSFLTQNKLLNAYYTQKELRTDTTYKIQVLCKNNVTSVKYEEIVTPTYTTPDWTIHWAIYGKDNAVWLIVLAFVGFLGLWFLFWVKKTYFG